MILLTILKIQSGTKYVSKSELIQAISEEYGEEKAAKIFLEFGKVMTPSTVPVISHNPLEFGIYLQDLCVMAKQLQLPIQLLDLDGSVIRVSDALSGIIR
ncbi:hypothetical protein Q9885_001696 [Vibrio parahaemolyticus]|nr:hypothetical protein [Vibrio parahaemolyticus]